MGKRNRERRAARQRKRQATGQSRQQRPVQMDDSCSCGQCSSRPSGDPFSSVEAIAATVLAVGDTVATGDASAAGECAEQLAGPSSPVPQRVLQQAAGSVLTGMLTALWAGGWQPRDVQQVVRRRLGADHVSLAVDLVADEAARYATATVDPRWLDQLADMGAEVRWAVDVPVLGFWAQRSGSDGVRTLTVALELLGLLLTLPGLQVLLPAPGSSRVRRRAGGDPGGRTEDQRALARVRALLAKAEGTDFPEEAEALSAKAQELMTRHSLERLVAEAASDDREPATARRLWLDAPYAGAKALLVDVVARANRCSAVWAQELGFATVIGDERDLTATELMVTSLLVQATRAMVDRGRTASVDGRSRSRAFRQSFLVAYAARIGERLAGANAAVEKDVVGADLLPVLVADRQRVTQAREALFPTTVQRSVAVSSYQGYAAGRAAADLAQLDTQLALIDPDRVAS